ncbi:uncharacterized protein LOC106508360 [Sus scrofa]|uniref:uncharacterized protein LOC106508360 n=1 Tax=Sus scrofa TaxID=9823 RepID=UPI000A2B8989|nr:uncharacterized protein LOC106508360 [Sus scrofa]
MPYLQVIKIQMAHQSSKRLGVAPPPGSPEKPGQGAPREGLQPRPTPGQRFPKNSGSPSPTHAPRDRAAASTSARRALRPGPDARSAPCGPRSCHPGGARARGGLGVPEAPAGGGWGGRKEDLQQYLGEEETGAAAAAAAAGGGGSGEGGGARALPLLLSPAPARPGPEPRTAPRAAPPALTLQRPALPRFLKLLIPGKLARGPGANPQTKSETSAGLERLLAQKYWMSEHQHQLPTRPLHTWGNRSPQKRSDLCKVMYSTDPGMRPGCSSFQPCSRHPGSLLPAEQ